MLDLIEAYRCIIYDERNPHISLISSHLLSADLRFILVEDIQLHASYSMQKGKPTDLKLQY